MKEIPLSKKSIYHGNVDMPEGFEIDYVQLVKDITVSQLYNKKIAFSKARDMVNTYVTDYALAYHKLHLEILEQKGKFYLPLEHSFERSLIDPLNLKHSPDYIMLYGVEIEPGSCKIKIFYDDNRRKNRYWEILLENNKFIMFPANLSYSVSKNLSDRLNYILTTTYHESK